MRHTLIALSAISALIGISQAHASEYKSLPVNKDARLTIGASATYNADAYRTDNSLIVLPQAFYDNNRLYIEGAELGARQDARDPFQLAAFHAGKMIEIGPHRHPIVAGVIASAGSASG